MFGYIAGKIGLMVRGYSPRRSSEWPALRTGWLKANPRCVYCLRKAVEVHHKIPFSFRPEWELDRSNLQSVCRKCHRIVAHCGDWKLWQDNVDEIAKLCAAGIRGRGK